MSCFVLDGVCVVDVCVTEGGGRVFNWVRGEWVEDEQWEHEREGLERVRGMCKRWGVRVDGEGYRDMVRGKGLEEGLIKELSEVEGVRVTGNMGNVDIVPETSGKDKAAEWVLGKIREEGREVEWVGTAGDDDNDVELAR